MAISDDLNHLVDRLDDELAARDDVALAQLRRQIRPPMGEDAADGQPQP